MNPWDLSASDLLVWGLVLHLIGDWLFQNDWMANNKKNLKHPAGYVHAGIHGIILSLVFGWAAIPLAIVHLLIDTRTPVTWWAQLIRQTPATVLVVNKYPLMSVGSVVRLWVDQVFHIACVAVAALLVTL